MRSLVACGASASKASQPRRKISPTGLSSAAYPVAERRVSSVSRSGSGHHGGSGPPARAAAATSVSLHGSEWSRENRSISRSVAATSSTGSWVGRSHATSSVERSGIRIAASPCSSTAAPRYAMTGSVRPGNQPRAWRLALASHASRMSSSRVARTIQSRAGDVRLRMNRSWPRSRALNVEPDQPSVGNGCSGDARQAESIEQLRERLIPPSAHAAASRLSTAPARRASRRARRPGTRRGSRGSCESGPRRGAPSRTRSPRHGSRPPGCR